MALPEGEVLCVALAAIPLGQQNPPARKRFVMIVNCGKLLTVGREVIDDVDVQRAAIVLLSQ